MTVTLSDPTIAQLADLALDPVSGDVLFPPMIIRGAAAIMQRIRVRFRWFLGEWFLDQRQGVPYYDKILVKSPDLPTVIAIFRKALSTTPGVLRVDSFTGTLDSATRTLTCDFQATLADGSTVLTAEAEPFILTG